MMSPVMSRLSWVIEIVQHGRLVDIIGPMSIKSIGPYWESACCKYLLSEGFRLRLVGYK